MNRTLPVFALLSALAACKRAPPLAHVVTVVDSGPVLMVNGLFGVPGPSSAMNPLGFAANVRPGRCVRPPSARQVLATVDLSRTGPVQTPHHRDVGELTVRDERDEVLAAVRPGMMGFYMAMVPRGAARRLRVEVAGGSGLRGHRFDSVPLNPAGNPARLTAPVNGFRARRGAPLRFAWAGNGYRDAFLQVMVADPGGGDGQGVWCRLDYGRGAITLRGEDLELRGHRGPAALSATLITATSSSEGPWLLNVMTTGPAVGGMLE